MDQAELARRSGASESGVSRMFSSGTASTKTVSQIAEALDLPDPVEQLLNSLKLLVEGYDLVDKTLDGIARRRK